MNNQIPQIQALNAKKKSKRHYPNIQKKMTRVDVRAKKICRALIHIVVQKYEPIVEKINSQADQAAELLDLLSNYSALLEDKESVIRIWMLIMNKVHNKGFEAFAHKRSIYSTLKLKNLREVNDHIKIVIKFTKCLEKLSNRSNRDFVQSHSIMKLGKHITLNENNGANIDEFWNKIFKHRKCLKQIAEEGVSEEVARAEYKKILLEDLENM